MSIIYEPQGRAREYSPLAANLYSGCLHGCAYCYAPGCLRGRLTREQFHKQASVRKDVIKQLEKDMKKSVVSSGDLFGQAQSSITDSVLLCFTCDAYQGTPGFNLVTRQALQLFRKYNIPFQVLTKGGMKAARDFDLYSEQDAFASTLTFYDEQKSIEYEPMAALPNDRIKALQEAKRQGITTWVSFEPVLNAEEVYKLFDATKEFVDLYKVGKCSGNYSTVKDWKTFGDTMIEKCEQAGVDYYIKDDLKRCL